MSPRRTLYRGGRIFSRRTLEDGGPSLGALLVEGDRVAWSGDPADAPAADAAIELDGAVVLPAFVDAHVHVTETGLLLTGLDLNGATSVREILDRVAAAARRRPGVPVLGHGWDERLLAEHRPPTMAEIERAAPGTDVYLTRVDVHSAVLSPRLAERAGVIGLPGWDPSGRVERDAHHAARRATRHTIPPAERRELHRIALRAAAAAGVAEVHEMSATHVAPEQDLVALVALAADDGERLPDVVPYRGELVADERQALDTVTRLGVPGLAGLAGDINVDGSVGSHTACFREDYHDAPGHRGHRYVDAAGIAAHVVACTWAGLQAGFHVIGDAAVDATLEGFSHAADRVGLDVLRRAGHRLEHIEAIDSAGVAELARLGLTASVQPLFDAVWGGTEGMYAQRLGMRRAGVMNPFAAMVAVGVPLALGSDSPVTPFDPWGAIRACVRHRTPAHRIDVGTAFAAHTWGGQAAARPGRPAPDSLAPGQPATFTVWAAEKGAGVELLAHLAGVDADRPPARCLLTIDRGRVIHDSGGFAPR